MKANREEMIKFFIESAKTERKNKEGYTYWQTLDIIDEKEFAIVLGWSDGFDTDNGWELCMKLAYKPTNSLMSEYDMDWIMPYDEKSGEVDDTDSEIGDETDIAETVNYLLEVYNNRYKQVA